MGRDDPNDDKILDRISLRADGWYVVTREGDRGPFALLEMAVIELDCYLDEVRPQLAQSSIPSS